MPEWGPEFPHLRDWIKTSEPTQDYNCVAHVCDDSERWWDPLPPGHYYWPDPKIGEDLDHSVERYVKLFEHLGYQLCADGLLEPGKEKVVIYANIYGGFEHVAKQLPDGNWTSKLDIREDITHESPRSLSDGHYGKAVVYMERIVAETKETSFSEKPSDEAARPANDENPKHREDFTRLLGAAVRKPPQED